MKQRAHLDNARCSRIPQTAAQIDEASMHDELDKTRALVCTEVWGGNRKVSRTVKLPSLMAWVASHPINDGEGGGNLHYMSVCDTA